MVLYDKFKNFGKIVKNSYGPIISNIGSSSFIHLNKDLDSDTCHSSGKINFV
jgi:hypothetical protein